MQYIALSKSFVTFITSENSFYHNLPDKEFLPCGGMSQVSLGMETDWGHMVLEEFDEGSQCLRDNSLSSQHVSLQPDWIIKLHTILTRHSGLDLIY